MTTATDRPAARHARPAAGPADRARSAGSPA